MLVDDKLAKEKLAQLAFDQQSDSTGYGESHTDGWNSACVQIAMLIRNTDLTDCQRPIEKPALPFAKTSEPVPERRDDREGRWG